MGPGLVYAGVNPELHHASNNESEYVQIDSFTTEQPQLASMHG